ncbi:MAG: hypothetical protein AAF411_13685 [Myxococcota bacterium]
MCATRVDDDDPNETPYLLCPAERRFALALRTVGSGRASIDVITPSGDRHPLRFADAVTPRMMEIDREVRWQSRPNGGSSSTFVARVHEHGDDSEPSPRTRTWHMLARVSEGASCIVAKSESEPFINAALENVETMSCLPTRSD